MKKKFKAYRLLLPLALCFTVHSMLAQSINDLDFLIGEWEVHETIYPGTEKEYTESGIRTCSYYLNKKFIKCDARTMVSKNGKERWYAYIINYHAEAGYFIATNFAHDFPLHGQHHWYMDKENKQLIAITPENVIRDRFFRGTISFANPNRIEWNGYASVYKESKDWKHIFQDVATRKR